MKVAKILIHSVESQGNANANGDDHNNNKDDANENESDAFKKAFDMFDLDGSGEISSMEFGTVIRSLGQNPTDEEVESMLKVR